jgi:hypothetical protein
MVDRMFLSGPKPVGGGGDRQLSIGEEVVVRLALAGERGGGVNILEDANGVWDMLGKNVTSAEALRLAEEAGRWGGGEGGGDGALKIMSFLRPSEKLTARRFGRLRERARQRARRRKQFN